MFRNYLFLVYSLFLFCLQVKAAEQTYHLDGHEGNWTAFHYSHMKQQIDSCHVLSNDLVLGFERDANNVGLILWDSKGKQIPGRNKNIALTINKEHFLFTMKAMDKNMLMNRLNLRDFNYLLQKLSYADLVVVEYGQQPVNIVDLLGLPSMLSKFNYCISQAKFGFSEYENHFP